MGDGLITDLDGSVSDDVALVEFEAEHNRTITWRQLLHQTSEWDGVLFGKVPTGHRGERLGQEMGVPGSFWEYNDVESTCSPGRCWRCSAARFPTYSRSG